MARRPRCAVCTLQYGKCPKDCPMALYFPSPPSLDLDDVKHLFGLGKLDKILHGIPPGEQRDVTAKTMVVEARMWRLDPLRGARGFMDGLTTGIEIVQKELEAVRRHLALYRPMGQAEARQHQHPGQQMAGGGGGGERESNLSSPALLPSRQESPQRRSSTTDERSTDELLREIYLTLGIAEDDVPCTSTPTAESATHHQDQPPPEEDFLLYEDLASCEQGIM